MRPRSVVLAVALLAAAVLAAVAVAVPGPADALSPPQGRPIVYVIVVDGLDGDRVEQGRAPYLSSLVAGRGARATYYRESRSVMVAETNPNHTAMMTGAYAGTSGVYANGFAVYHPVENEDSCRATGPVDLRSMPSETSGENADCLRAETTFASILRQGDPDELTTAAFFGKAKLGRIFNGRTVPGRPRDVDHLWAPCDPDDPTDEDYCDPDALADPYLTYTVQDSIPMDAVIESMGGVGPRNRRPDLTFVNLPNVDTAGHLNGPGPSYDTQISAADTQIRRLVETLRERGEWDRTTLFVVSDHSMDQTLTKTMLTDVFTEAGVDEDRFMAIGKSGADLIYLADRLDEGRFALLKRMRELALARPGVAEALYREPNPLDGGARHTIDGTHPAWRNGSGQGAPDLLVTHRPGGSFADPGIQDQPLPGHHGAPHTRDNFLAVISGGDGVRQQTLEGAREVVDDTERNPRQAENVDIAPTVMGLFGLAAPRDNQGRFLSEAFDLDRLPGAGEPSARPRVRLQRLRASRADRRRGVRRVRVALGPRSGAWDVDLRSGRRLRSLRRVARGTRADTLTLTLRRGRRYRLQVRLRAASGETSPAVRRLVRVR